MDTHLGDSADVDPEETGVSEPVRRAVWTVCVCSLFASIVVLLLVGYHASLLGDVPINLGRGPGREDIWAHARSRYNSITVVTVAVMLMAWTVVLAWWPTPRRIVRRDSAAARWRLVLLIFLSVVAGAALAASPYAVSVSRPMFVGVVAVVVTAAAGVAGLLLRGTAQSGPELAGAATAVVVPALTVAPAALTAYLAWQLYPNPLVFVPLVAYALWLLPGVPLSVAVIRHWRRLLNAPAVDASASDASHLRSVEGSQKRSPGEWVLTVSLVVLAGTVAIWVAQPVPAPPAHTVPPFQDQPVPVPAITAQPWPGDPGDGAPKGSGEPQPVPDAIDTCNPRELDIVALGDGAEYAMLVATNLSEDPCALRGHVVVRLMQGGERIDLRPVADYDEPPLGSTDLGAVLEPGGHAHAELRWPGYGTAADHDTPQQLYVTVDPSAGAEAPVRLQIAPGSEERSLDGTVTPIPAPFDLKADVDGGAEIRTSVWTPGL